MKKFLTVLCALILALTCVISLSAGTRAADANITDLLASESSWGSHHYGVLGSVARGDDNSVRVLANTKNGHYGVMLKKEAVESLVNAGYETLSFKMTTESYNSGEVPGYVDVYTSGVNAANYQLSLANGTRNGTDDVYYASGSVVEVDLVKLNNNSSFTEGLKFILKKAAASGNAATCPAYLVLSNIKTTGAVSNPVELLTLETSYGSYANGEFGGVTAVDENGAQILAKEKDGIAGFMLNKSAIEKMLLLGVNEMTVTLTPAAYESGTAPKYVVLESAAAPDYYIENCGSVAAKIDGNKAYFAAGTKITIKIHKLYADMYADNGLKFALLSGNTWTSGSATAYLTLENLSFVADIEDHNLDLVTTNGDFIKYYENEGSWAKMTEKSIRAVAAAGFRYIDISFYRVRATGANSELMQDGWEKIVQDLKDLAEELNVEFRMAHSPGYTGHGSVEWVNCNKRCIEICEMLGIENYVDHGTVRPTKDEFFKVNLANYEKILPFAAEHNVNILCENSTYKNMANGGWYINTGADTREFVKYVQSKGYSNFHACWDTGHANCEGAQYLDIIALGDEMYGIHFHDNLGKDTHNIPYYGNMNIDEVMRAYKLIGYSGQFTLEIDGSPRTTSSYHGPELEGGLNPYTENRFEQEQIIYQIMNYILERHDCACEEHTFQEPTWRWMDDNTTAQLLIDCKDCSYRKVVDAEVTHKEGTLVYSATATYEGKTYTDVVTYYTVVFKNWDGTVLSTNLYRKGDKVKAPADPTRAKDSYYEYTFAGWDKKIADCAGDAVYTAVYNKKHYHTYTKKVTAPTCTEKGYTTYTCACKDTYKDNYVNAAGHKYPSLCDVKCTVCGIYKGHKYTHSCDRTCNDCGTSRTIQHTYKDACDAICDVCGVGRVAPHSYAAATCTKAKTCKCGATSGSALGHKYTNSCDTSCNTCGAKRTVTHSYEAATCTKAKTCKTCGATSGSALGHKYSNECDASCNTCGAKRTVKHSYKTTTTKATLKKDGSTVKKCTKCGDVESKKTIKKIKTVKLSKTSFTYNGKTQKPSVTVKDSAGKTLKKGTDYTVTYAKGCKNVGTYKVTIKFKGKYSGTKTLTFKINPPKATLKKVTSLNDALKVTVNKKTTQVTGYQIQYSTSKSFTKATTKTIKSAKTTSLTLKKLKSNKKYFVRVRTFKTVDGTKFYSGWSSYKTAKTK